MCQLLIKAVDSIHPDQVVNLRDCYKRGDVVTIQSDGHKWGIAEKDPAVFLIVKKPGVSVSVMSYLLNAEKNPVWFSAALKIPSLARLLMKQTRDSKKRRRFSFDVVTQKISDKGRI